MHTRGSVCFAALNKDFSQECSKRKYDARTESERQTAADNMSQYKKACFCITFRFSFSLLYACLVMLQIYYEVPENRAKKRKGDEVYNNK